MAIPAGTHVVGNQALIALANTYIVVKFRTAGIDVRDRRALLGKDPRAMPVPVPRVAGDIVELARNMIEDRSIIMPLSGPRSAGYVVARSTLAGAGGFLSRHHRW
eukprot:4617564-Heterocapsa_arctica.AAC.1